MSRAIYLTRTYPQLAIGASSEGGIKFHNHRFETDNPEKMALIEKSDLYLGGEVFGGIVPDDMELPAPEPPGDLPPEPEVDPEEPRESPEETDELTLPVDKALFQMTKDELLVWLDQRGVVPPPGTTRPQLLGIATQLSKAKE